MKQIIPLLMFLLFFAACKKEQLPNCQPFTSANYQCTQTATTFTIKISGDYKLHISHAEFFLVDSSYPYNYFFDTTGKEPINYIPGQSYTYKKSDLAWNGHLLAPPATIDFATFSAALLTYNTACTQTPHTGIDSMPFQH